jgi:hypothetical protein
MQAVEAFAGHDMRIEFESLIHAAVKNGESSRRIATRRRRACSPRDCSRRTVLEYHGSQKGNVPSVSKMGRLMAFP